MNRRMLARILEAFFRHPALYVLPLILLVGAGLITVVNSGDEYSATGTILIDPDSFIEAQTGVSIGQNGTFLTPAQYASQELNGLLQTDEFVEDLLDDAQLPAALFVDQVDMARSAVVAYPTSESLMQVRVTTETPLASERLATAAIDQFVKFKIDLDVEESSAAERFFTDQVQTYETELVAARSARDLYLESIGFSDATSPIEEGEVAIDDETSLTVLQQAELEDLTDDVDAARVRYETASENLAAAQQARSQAENNGSLRVVDQPTAPSSSDNGLLDKLVTVAMFTIVGLILAGLGPVVAASLERGVLFPDELADAGVIAVVPNVSKSDIWLPKSPIPAPTSTAPLAAATSWTAAEASTPPVPFQSEPAASFTTPEAPPASLGTDHDETDDVDDAEHQAFVSRWRGTRA